MRRGALERVGLLLADWRDTQAWLAGTEHRMVTVRGELGLTELATSITGLSAAGAPSILAETGDLARFTTGRALAGHSGAGASAKDIRYLHRPHPHYRPGPARAAARGLAGGLGRAETPAPSTPPVRAPDQPRAQQADPPGKPTPCSPPRCCTSYTPSSPPGSDGTPPSSPAASKPGAWPPPDTTGRRSSLQSWPGRAPPGTQTLTAISPHILGSPARRHANPITRCRAPSP
jgi:hypothetical protein